MSEQQRRDAERQPGADRYGATGPRLFARAWRLDEPADALAVAGPAGFVWESGQHVIAGRGEALRIALERGDVHDGVRGERGGTEVSTTTGGGPGRRATEVLADVALDGDPGAPLPAALAALPFDPGAPGELVVPALQVRHGPEGARWLLAVATAPTDLPGTRPCPVLEPSTGAQPSRHVLRAVEDPAAWMGSVVAAREQVRAGRMRKVVLARAVDLEVDVDLQPDLVLARLRQAYPTCLRFSVDGLVGASPELLVARRGDIVTAQPMAGTTPRLGDPVADAQAAARLLASAKDRAEHQVTIDRVEEALLPYCSYLDAQAEPQVVAVANVAHLATRVEGRLSAAHPPVLDLVAALHPTPAVGGDPLDEALAAIARLEPRGRGRYAGPVGWCDGTGDGEFAVGIRSAEVDGPRARLYAGVGVVAGSDPAAELAETRAKFQAMLVALVRL
jgi:menaquinone-specific isochorismate synthase